LKQQAMAPAEIKRFTDRFALKPLIDTEGKATSRAGLNTSKMTGVKPLEKIE
jgi:hypothetical protein